MEQGFCSVPSAIPVCHMQRFKKCRLTDRVLGLVENTCLHKFASSVTPIDLDHRLLGYMCQSYDTSDSLFHIEGEELSMTLIDIYYMTGLPITGRPVIGNGKYLRSLCEEYLGISLSEKSVNIDLNLLKQLIGTGSDDPKMIEMQARAYLLYIIGCFLVPRSSKDDVPAMYLILLRDLTQVDSYAWGAALLSFFHDSLATASDNLRKNINKQKDRAYITGCSLLLQMLAVYRIKKLAACFFNIGELPKSFPLVKEWTKVMFEKKKHHKHSLMFPRDILSDDGEVIVNLLPYADIEAPDDSKEQLKMCSAKVHLICMDKLWLYEGFKFMKQIPEFVPFGYDGRKRKTKNKKQRSAKDIITKNEAYIEAWYDAHMVLQINPMPASLPPLHKKVRFVLPDQSEEKGKGHAEAIDEQPEVEKYRRSARLLKK